MGEDLPSWLVRSKLTPLPGSRSGEQNSHQMNRSQGDLGHHLRLLIIYSKYWVLGAKRDKKSASIDLLVLKKGILKIIRHI